MLPKIVRQGLLAMLAGALAGCYTQVKTAPPLPPGVAVIEPQPVAEGIDGEYSGSIQVVDETGHHTARIQLGLSEGWYRATVEGLPVVEGEYQLRDGEIILMEQGWRDGFHDWRMAPSGHFELRATDTGLTLVQRLPGRGSYREVVLSRDSAAP